jgi:hypothetical protein
MSSLISVLGCAVLEHLARVDDVRPVAHAEGLLDVVVRDQDRDALVLQATDLRPGGPRRRSGRRRERLVEQDQARVGDERPGDLELASLAARARAGLVLGLVRQPELLEQRGGTLALAERR